MRLFKKILILSTFTIGIWSLDSGCYYDREEDLYPAPASCDTVGVKYSTVVSPLMTNLCRACHSGLVPSGGVKLESYADLKAYATTNRARFLGSMYHSSGYSAMPKGGAKMPNCDVQKIEAWLNAGGLNN